MNLIFSKKVPALQRSRNFFSCTSKFYLLFFIGQLIATTTFSQHWNSLGGSLQDEPTKLYFDSTTNTLIAAGKFRLAENRWCPGIASWNGAAWDSLGHGLDNFDSLNNFTPQNTWAITRYNGYLYCGGAFVKAGYDSINAFARWDGTQWDSVPNARITFGHNVKDIQVYNNELYICGYFDSVGNVPADGIAKWNGATWSAIGSNYNFADASNATSLNKIKFYHGKLYVSGAFYDPLGNFCHLAFWDGTNWNFLTNVVTGGLAFINDLEVFNDELYAGGIFYQSSGSIATGIVRWNDTTWRDVGGSVEVEGSNPFPSICDMEVHNGKLFCVGNFVVVGGITANYLASWDGVDWCSYGSVFDNKLLQIAFFNDTMYVTGGFWTIDGDSITNIAKWIGGSFVDTCGNATGMQEPIEVNQPLVFPNPASEIVSLQFATSETRTITLMDELGREIYVEESDDLLVNIAVDHLAVGVYFYSILQGGTLTNGKLLIVR